MKQTVLNMRSIVISNWYLMLLRGSFLSSENGLFWSPGYVESITEQQSLVAAMRAALWSQSRRILELFSSSSPSALLFSLESGADSLSQTFLVFSCQAVLYQDKQRLRLGQCQRPKQEILFPTFRTRSLLYSNETGVEHFTRAKITFWSLSQGQKVFVLFPWKLSKIASVSLVHSLCGIQE